MFEPCAIVNIPTRGVIGALTSGMLSSLPRFQCGRLHIVNVCLFARYRCSYFYYLLLSRLELVTVYVCVVL